MVVTSNKVSITIQSQNIKFTTPIAKAILTVSSDGINYSASASGHKLYFKVNTYDANGQPADTYIRGIGNITGALTGKWELDFITYGQVPFQKLTSNMNWNADIIALTENGTLIFSVEWYEACISQEYSTNLSDYQQTSMHLSYDTLPFSKQDHIFYTNNVSYIIVPESICTPKNISITLPAEKYTVTCMGYSNSIETIHIYYIKQGYTYNLMIKVTDSNGNPCPNCTFNPYGTRLYSNSDGIIQYQWTATGSNLMPVIDMFTLLTASGNVLQPSMQDFNITVNGEPYNEVLVFINSQPPNTTNLSSVLYCKQITSVEKTS